jgi:NAD(P)-dependent dehydrogenase (short-subunit alcohol dehydrogenase family)
MIKRFGEPREVANVILMAASDEASYMTGSTLVVDGGYSS